jgi:hypothetical protein
VELVREFTVANAATDLNRQAFVWPYSAKGKIVDIMAVLEVAGSITALTITPKKNNSAAICSTNGVITVAAGVGAAIDAKAEMTLPAGGTRFGLGAEANRTLSKGDRVTLDFAQSGVATTGAQVKVHCVFESME